MKYIYLINNKVHEIIEEFNPVFPDVPITERYTSEFLANCVTVDDDTEVNQNDIYIDGEFVKPIEPEPEIPPETLPDYLNAVKEQKITQSKTDLQTYLANHPLQWTDGKYYTITAEKQQQLTSKLLSATFAQQTGTPYDLKWNDTEQVCVSWTLENLTALAFAIDARVTALVTYQQEKEREIRDAETLETLESIVVNYDEVV